MCEDPDVCDLLVQGISFQDPAYALCVESACIKSYCTELELTAMPAPAGSTMHTQKPLAYSANMSGHFSQEQIPETLNNQNVQPSNSLNHQTV